MHLLTSVFIFFPSRQATATQRCSTRFFFRLLLFLLLAHDTGGHRSCCDDVVRARQSALRKALISLGAERVSSWRSALPVSAVVPGRKGAWRRREGGPRQRTVALRHVRSCSGPRDGRGRRVTYFSRNAAYLHASCISHRLRIIGTQ